MGRVLHDQVTCGINSAAEILWKMDRLGPNKQARKNTLKIRKNIYVEIKITMRMRDGMGHRPQYYLCDKSDLGTEKSVLEATK